jgi:hypothetical protein
MATTSYGDYDAWQRHALVSVDDGTTEVQMHALTSSINIEGGERDIDTIPLLNLGQVVKHGPAGMITVTFEGYALGVGTASAGTATGVWDIFAETPAKDSSDPFSVTISTTRTRYQVAILWTNDGDATKGTSAVTQGTSYAGIRFVLAECFCTAHTADFTDGVLKFTLTFKGPAIDKAAAGNVKWESVLKATNAALTAVTAYVPGTTKW